MEEHLNKSGSKYLIGSHMTIADIVVGSEIMRFVHNTAAVSPKFKESLAQFPKVTEWSNMINMVFGTWFKSQPERPY